MKQRRYCQHKQNRLRHEDSVKSLGIESNNNKYSMKINEQSLVNWQYQNRMKNRRMQRQKGQYGKILSHSNSNKKSLNISEQQFQYPIAYTNRDDITNEKISAQQQLKQQLQKQIVQLLPIKKSFFNLSHYYQQINQEYNTLLQEMQIMNRILLPSNNNNILKSQELRGLQIEYQQSSEYVSIHLVPRLTLNKKQNLGYCQLFNKLDVQLKQGRQLMRNNMMERQILNQQFIKIKEELSQEDSKHHQSQLKVQRVGKSLFDNQQRKRQYSKKLQILKQCQQHRFQQQTQLLQSINEKKSLNNKLIVQTKEKKQKQRLAEQLHQQRKTRITNDSIKLKTNQERNQQLIRKLTLSKRQTLQLSTKLQSVESELKQKQSTLSSMVQKQIPQLQTQCNQLKQQFIKNHKFLTYLTEYQKQLKSTSALMFNKLNESCQQDYQKLIKNKPVNNCQQTLLKNFQQPLINNFQKETINDKFKFKDQNQQKQKPNIKSLATPNLCTVQSPSKNQVNFKVSNFKFDKQSVQKLIQQRAQLQTHNLQSYT